jgi:hypothetical protein
VLLEHGGHLFELAAGGLDLGGQTLRLGVDEGVLGDAPERLLELGRGEERPAVDLGPRPRVGRQQALLRILLGEVEHDRHRLGDHEIAVDQHRQLAGGVDRAKLGPHMLALL